MSSFDEMLAKLHNNALLTDMEQCIEINNKRQFIIPPDFDTTIAYEGDVNSQIVTFVCPITHEGHDLSQCEYKKLLWVNKTSGAEGVSTLTNINSEDPTTQKLEWLVPPEVFTKAGTIELSISLYDLVGGSLAFAWNTATFSQLQVGSTMQEVGLTDVNTHTTGRRAPARNEILTIDLDRRNIVVPSGYNYMVANYGEIGLSTLHFQVNRYYKNLDLTQATITIVPLIGGESQEYNIFTNNPNRFLIYADGSNGDGIIQFDWRIPEEITNNSKGYTGTFSLGISFRWNNDKQILRLSTFDGLKIGGTIIKPSTPFDDTNSGYHIKGEGFGINGVTSVLGIVSLREGTNGSTTLNTEETCWITNDLNIESKEGGLLIQDGPMEKAARTFLWFDKSSIPNPFEGNVYLKLQCVATTDNITEEGHHYYLYLVDPQFNKDNIDWDNQPQILEFPIEIDPSLIVKGNIELDITNYVLSITEDHFALALCSVGSTTDNHGFWIDNQPILLFEPEEKLLKKNELIAEYDKNGNYVGLKIGTVRESDGDQAFSQAPYVFSTELFNQTIKTYLEDPNRKFTFSAE